MRQQEQRVLEAEDGAAGEDHRRGGEKLGLGSVSTQYGRFHF